MNTTIQLSDTADPAIREAIAGPLVAYNARKTGRNDYRPLVLTLLNEEGRVIGGLWGRTSSGWLFVELIFLPEELRGQDLGTDLMKRAESEAIARGCHSAWLDTFEFQARGFYEKLGYSLFGELSDYPPGFRRYFMKKALTGSC